VAKVDGCQPVISDNCQRINTPISQAVKKASTRSVLLNPELAEMVLENRIFPADTFWPSAGRLFIGSFQPAISRGLFFAVCVSASYAGQNLSLRRLPL